MLRKLIILVVLGMVIMTNGGCMQSSGMVERYSEDDFVNLKAGTPYEEVVKRYGGTDDGWGNLLYTLDNGNTIRVTISMNKQVLLVETGDGNTFEKSQKWIDREKSESGNILKTRHRKQDFDAIKEGMSFDGVEKNLGLNYTLIGNGFIIAKYLTEDFKWVIIGCGQHDLVQGISFED